MTVLIETPSSQGRRGAAARFFRNPLGLVPFVILMLIVVASLLAPWIAPHDPEAPDLSQVNSGPNATYWLGGDSGGRDILSRLLIASRLTLTGAVVVAVVAAAVGVGSGLLAGYAGRYFDTALSWVNNVLMAIPAIIILVALYAVIGPNAVVTMAAFGVLVSPFLFRLVRALVIAVRSELYVDAARVSGLSDSRIMVRHILAAIRAPVLITTSGMVGAGIMIQAGLEFLGLGSPSQPTWGGILQNAFTAIYRAPWSIVWPGLAIGLTAGCLALIANALRDALEESAPPRPGRRPKLVGTQDIERPKVTDEPPGADVLLSARGLKIGYPLGRQSPRVVVEEVDLTVGRGEILGLVGESGSGKTQTAFAMLGLLPREAIVLAGSVRFEGRELLGMPDSDLEKLRGRRIAYVPQEPMSNLDPSYTIGYQLSRPMRRHLGLSREAARERSLQLLDRVGIPNAARTYDAYPHEISGGMAQRVLIASAVSCDPDLIIADEPTTALDVTVQAEILDLLRDLQQERHLSMILVTHNFGVVADLCNRVAVMQQGRIVEVGDVTSIFDRPSHPYTQKLLGSTLEGGPSRTSRKREVEA